MKCGKHVVETADLSGSRLHEVNRSEVEFDDINTSRARRRIVIVGDSAVEDLPAANRDRRLMTTPAGRAGPRDQVARGNRDELHRTRQ